MLSVFHSYDWGSGSPKYFHACINAAHLCQMYFSIYFYYADPCVFLRNALEYISVRTPTDFFLVNFGHPEADLNKSMDVMEVALSDINWQ